jgi:hypothetical protein
MTIPNDIFETMPAGAYADLRPSIRNGDILLFSGREVFSHLIQWATKSPWSHVGFVFRLEAIDRVMILESLSAGGSCTVALSAFVAGTGPHQRPYNGKLLIARHRRFGDLASAARLRKMSEFAVDRFGAPYSPAEIIKIGVRIALGRLNIRLPPGLRPDDEYICSEYAAACYEAVGIKIPWNGLGFIAPADFATDPDIEPVAVIRTA